MTALEIILLIAGAGLLAASFFVSEKLSSSDVDYIHKLSEKEVKIILEKELSAAEGDIDSRIQEKTDDAVAEIERATDRDTNDKLLSMNEFSDTVLSSMNNSHDEVMFLYNRLNDKQQKLDEQAAELAETEKKLTAMKASVDAQLKKLSDEKVIAEERQEEIEKEAAAEKERLSAESKAKEDVASLKEAFKNRLEAEGSTDAEETEEEQEGSSLREKILSAKKDGLSEIEIAKKLGCGLGEVRLVLDRFEAPEGSAS